jgi:hypothetical protein
LIGTVDPIPMGVLRMEPRKTDVGDLLLNKENEVRIVLANDGDAPLTVSRIVSKKSGTEYFVAGKTGGIEIAPGQTHAMKLVVQPDKPGRYLERIDIYSDARNDIGKGYSGLLSGTVK